MHTENVRNVSAVYDTQKNHPHLTILSHHFYEQHLENFLSFFLDPLTEEVGPID